MNNKLCHIICTCNTLPTGVTQGYKWLWSAWWNGLFKSACRRRWDWKGLTLRVLITFIVAFSLRICPSNKKNEWEMIIRLTYVCILRVHVSIFYPLEVVDRGSDPHLQVGKILNSTTYRLKGLSIVDDSVWCLVWRREAAHNHGIRWWQGKWHVI